MVDCGDFVLVIMLMLIEQEEVDTKQRKQCVEGIRPRKCSKKSQDIDQWLSQRDKDC